MGRSWALGRSPLSITVSSNKVSDTLSCVMQIKVFALGHKLIDISAIVHTITPGHLLALSPQTIFHEQKH